MIYCSICKDYFKIDHDDLWDCIEVYEKKNNQVGETMKTWINNLHKKNKVKKKSDFCRWSKKPLLHKIN